MSKGTLVFSFGRMSPPTVGHEKLVNKVLAVAKVEKGTPAIYVSHTFDKKKNPLQYADKIRFVQQAFGPVVKKSEAKTAFDVAKQAYADGYTKLIMVVGSDRVAEFETKLSAYNHPDKLFNFDELKVVSAGDRDPDDEGVAGMSASKMRAAVAAGEFEKFKSGLPHKLQSHAKEVYEMTKKGMGLTEEASVEELLEAFLEEIEEDKQPLTLAQRRKRGMVMRRYKNKLKVARERAKRRKASEEKLKTRARKRARNILRSKFAAGKQYGDMTPSEKIAVDRRIARIPDTAVTRIANRQLPTIRRAELQRIASLGQNKVDEAASPMIVDPNTANVHSTIASAKAAADAHRAKGGKAKIQKHTFTAPTTGAKMVHYKVVKEGVVETGFNLAEAAGELDIVKKHIADAKKHGYYYNGTSVGFTSHGDEHYHEFRNDRIGRGKVIRVHVSKNPANKGAETIITRHEGQAKTKTHDSWESAANAHISDEKKQAKADGRPDPFAKPEEPKKKPAAKKTVKKESVEDQFLDFISEVRDGTPAKRYHQLFDGEKKPKLDGRFKPFKKKAEVTEETTVEDLMVMVEAAVSPADREEGTDSLVKAYSGDTPGQGKKITEGIEHYTFHKTGEKVQTTAHPAGKPVYDVHYKGEKIGRIEPYSSYKDTKKPGARIVSSRKDVTRYSMKFEPGKGKNTRMSDLNGIHDLKHAAEVAHRYHNVTESTNVAEGTTTIPAGFPQVHKGERTADGEVVGGTNVLGVKLRGLGTRLRAKKWNGGGTGQAVLKAMDANFDESVNEETKTADEIKREIVKKHAGHFPQAAQDYIHKSKTYGTRAINHLDDHHGIKPGHAKAALDAIKADVETSLGKGAVARKGDAKSTNAERINRHLSQKWIGPIKR